MDIQHIKYFFEVARCKSFSKAAEHLFVTQPILTRCIKKMEEELEQPLIIRSTKSFALTDAGEALVIYGSQLVEQYEDIYRHLQDIKESKVGEIHISSPGVLLDMYFPKLVTEYRKKYPGIKITISERGSRLIAQDVLDGKVDIGLVMLPIEEAYQLNVIPIIRDEVCVLVRRDHAFAKKEYVHIKQLQEVEIITYNKNNTLYNKFVEMCQEQGFVPDIIYQSMMPNFVMDVITYGNCVGIMPAPMLEQFQTEDLVSIPLRPHFPWEIAMITKKGRYLPKAANSFLEFVQEYL
jgi:DNA-binding transcriptional LysR family regulator